MINKLIFTILGQIINVLGICIVPIIVVFLISAVLYSMSYALSEKLTGDTSYNFSELLLGGFSKYLTVFVEKIPVFLVMATIIAGISVLSQFTDKIYSLWGKQQRIKELTTYVRNLSNSDEIARITIKDKLNLLGNKSGVYQIEVLDGVTGDVVSDEEIKLNGSELRFDSLVINFDYSEIGAGNQKNLAFPYRVFSEKIAPKDAVLLKSLFSEKASDEIINSELDEMLGLSKEIFKKRAQEFIEIIKDPIQRQELGIRSSYGNTITIPSNSEKNDVYVIEIEGTGGLTLKKIYSEKGDLSVENIIQERNESVTGEVLSEKDEKKHFNLFKSKKVETEESQTDINKNEGAPL